MLPVTVITVAILALAEGSYQYNTPHASFLLPVNKMNFQTGHVSRNIASMTIGNTNSGYAQPSSLLDANLNYYANLLRTVAGPNFNPGYTHTPTASTATDLNSAYMNPSVVSNNLNSILPARAYFNPGNTQNLPGSVGLNFRNAHNPVLPARSNLLQHNAVSNLAYPTSSIPVSANLNNGYYAQSFLRSCTASSGQGFPVNSQSLIQSATGNLNTGYSQVLAVPGTAGLNNGYAQKWIPYTSGDLKSGSSQNLTPSVTSNLSNGYTQNWIPSGSPDNLNSQSLAAKDSLSNVYGQKLLPFAGNLNTGHSQSLSSFGTNGLSQDNSQSSIPSASSNLNTGDSQSLLLPITSGSSHSYYQPLIPSPTGNMNTGNSQSLVAPGTSTLNSGYSQISSPHVRTNLNNGYSEPFPSPASVSSSSNLNAVQNLVPQTSSLSFRTIDNNVQTSGLNTDIGYSSPTDMSHRVPVDIPSTIYRHVYFHVPPLEDEQKVIRPDPPQKKNYKILFIKVPSQERNLQQIAQLRNNAAAAVEHKTLIYVLVKKPEAEQPVVTPQQTPSEHEVFFVKYNGNPLDLAGQLKGELDESGSVQSMLELGLANGQNKSDDIQS